MNLPHSKRLKSEARRVLTNVAWLSSDQIIRLALNLFVGAWVARYLGPESYGFLNYGISIVAIISVVSTFGIDGIAVREIVKDKSKAPIILGTSFVMKLFGGLLVVIISLATICIIKRGDTAFVLLVGIISVSYIFQAFRALDFYYQAEIKSKYYVIVRNGVFIVTSAIKVCFIIFKLPVLYFAFVYSLDLILASAGLIVPYLMIGKKLSTWRFDWQLAKNLLRDGWPIIISSISIMIYMRIDQIMIGEMIDETNLGYYSAAVKISEMWYFIPAAIVTSFFPKIVEYKSLDSTLYKERLQMLFSALALLGYVIVIPVSILSGTIIRVLFGAEYAISAKILSFHVWAGLFVCIGVVRSRWILAENFTRFMLISTATGSVLNVILNLFFIPGIGVIGAALATLIAQIVSSYLTTILKSRKVFVMQTKALLLHGLFQTKKIIALLH